MKQQQLFRGLWKNKLQNIDIKKVDAYNNGIRKASFSGGLTLKSDILVDPVTDRWRTTLKTDIFTNFVGRWQTTLKLATKREYVAQWCYYSLFKFMEDYKKSYEIHQGRGKKTCLKLCKTILAKAPKQKDDYNLPRTAG